MTGRCTANAMVLLAAIGGMVPAVPCLGAAEGSRKELVAVLTPVPCPAGMKAQWDRALVSPDGRRLAYFAEKDGKWHVVVDGKASAGYDKLLGGSRPWLRFSPDSKRVLWAVRKGWNQHVVLDGRLGPAYKEILRFPSTPGPEGLQWGDAPRFSLDSSRVAYQAKKSTQIGWAVDGPDGPVFHAIAEPKPGKFAVSPFLSKSFLHVFSVVTNGARGSNSAAVVRDGIGGPRCWSVDNLVVSDCGMHWAARCVTIPGEGRGPGWYGVLVDGRQRETRAAGVSYKLLLSRDGEHSLYAISRLTSGQQRPGDTYIVHDGKEYGPYGRAAISRGGDLVTDDLVLSEDGKHFLASVRAPASVALAGPVAPAPIAKPAPAPKAPDAGRSPLPKIDIPKVLPGGVDAGGILNGILGGSRGRSKPKTPPPARQHRPVPPAPPAAPQSTATTENEFLVIHDGRIIAKHPPNESGRRFTLKPFMLSPDGTRVAYPIKLPNGKDWAMVIDGKVGRPYESVGKPCFSPDSRRVAYTMSRSKLHGVVVNDREIGPYEHGISPAGSLARRTFRARSRETQFFSPDSKHFAYWADGKVYLDAEPAFDAPSGHELGFTSDSQHLIAFKGSEIIVDGRRIGLDGGADVVAQNDTPPIVLDRNRTLLFFARGSYRSPVLQGSIRLDGAAPQTTAPLPPAGNPSVATPSAPKPQTPAAPKPKVPAASAPKQPSVAGMPTPAEPSAADIAAMRQRAYADALSRFQKQLDEETDPQRKAMLQRMVDMLRSKAQKSDKGKEPTDP